MASIGPPALGAKGCVERLRRFAQGATAVEGAFKFIEGASLYKIIQPPCGRRKCIPLWCLMTPPSHRARWWRQPPKGGKSHRRWLITVMLFMTYDADRLIRNADFKTCGVSRHHHPRPEGPSPPERSEHNPPPSGGHNPRAGGPSTLARKAPPKGASKPLTSSHGSLTIRILTNAYIYRSAGSSPSLVQYNKSMKTG